MGRQTPRRTTLEDRSLEPYPLRQSLQVSEQKLASLRESAATEWISKPDRYLLVDDGEQLTLCAANEQALDEATPLVAAALGSSAHFGTPRAHTALRTNDGERLHPMMFVRVQVSHAHVAHLREELSHRGARLVEEDPQGDRVVLRAEAPLAALIGFRKFLQDTTNARFELWSWLTRYETAGA